MARVTKQNVLTCKAIKGGRAACWIKEKGRIVFRFASKQSLKRLGIPLRSAKRGRVSMALTGGFTFDGKHCRDAQNKFVPVSQCTGRRPKKGKKATKRKKSLSGNRRSRSGRAGMKPGCKRYRNGRIACPTSKGWRIIG